MKYLSSLLILVFAALFFAYGFGATHSRVKDYVSYEASFVSIGHLKAGAPVDIAGVKVGYVQDVKLDPTTFSGKVTFAVGKDWKLPEDSQIEIGAPTLNSADALEITPGKSDKPLAAKGMFSNTVDPQGIEDRISNFIFGAHLS